MESFFDNSLWKILPSIITVASGFALFLLGQVASTIKERRKEEKRLKDVREYFYVCLLRFQMGLERQIQIFDNATKVFDEDLQKSISINRGIRWTIEASPSQLLSILKNDTFKFFVLKKKLNKQERITLYSSFYTLIEVTDYNYKKILEVNDKYVDSYNTNVEAIEKHINVYLDMLLKETHTKVAEGKMHSFYEELMQIYHKYISLEERTPDTIQNHLSIPVHSKCIEYATHPDSFKIILLTQYTEVVYRTLLTDKAEFNLHIKLWDKQYKDMLNKINKMIELEFKDFQYGKEILESKKKQSEHKKDK